MRPKPPDNQSRIEAEIALKDSQIAMLRSVVIEQSKVIIEYQKLRLKEAKKVQAYPAVLVTELDCGVDS